MWGGGHGGASNEQGGVNVHKFWLDVTAAHRECCHVELQILSRDQMEVDKRTPSIPRVFMLIYMHMDPACV